MQRLLRAFNCGCTDHPHSCVRRHADLDDAQLPVVDERWRPGFDEVHEVGVGEVLHDGSELAALGVGERDVDDDDDVEGVKGEAARGARIQSAPISDSPRASASPA